MLLCAIGLRWVEYSGHIEMTQGLNTVDFPTVGTKILCTSIVEPRQILVSREDKHLHVQWQIIANMCQNKEKEQRPVPPHTNYPVPALCGVLEH